MICATLERPSISTRSLSSAPESEVSAARSSALPFCVSANTCWSIVDLAQFGAHDGGALGEGFQLAERRLAREVLHAAVGRGHQALGRHVLERGADAPRDFLGALHLLGAEVDHAQDHRLRREILQHPEIEAWLRGL